MGGGVNGNGSSFMGSLTRSLMGPLTGSYGLTYEPGFLWWEGGWVGVSMEMGAHLWAHL